MSEEAKKPEERWQVTQFGDKLYGCVLTSTEDGKTVTKTSTGSIRPDLNGDDIALISRLCARFQFNVTQLADECRMADSRKFADRECERLNRELEKPEEA